MQFLICFCGVWFRIQKAPIPPQMHDIFRETGANIQLLNPEQSISHGPAQAGDEAAQIRHDQSDGRDKGDQEQCHDHGGEQRHDVLGNALDLDLADAAAESSRTRSELALYERPEGESGTEDEE